MTPSLTITDAAQEYIAELLAKQGGEVNIRVFVADPGTPGWDVLPIQAVEPAAPPANDLFNTALPVFFDVSSDSRDPAVQNPS